MLDLKEDINVKLYDTGDYSCCFMLYSTERLDDFDVHGEVIILKVNVYLIFKNNYRRFVARADW